MLILFKKTRLYKGTFNAAAQEEQAAVTQMVLAIVVHPFSDLMMNKSKTVEGKGRKSGGGGGVKIKKKNIHIHPHCFVARFILFHHIHKLSAKKKKSRFSDGEKENQF